MQTLTPPQTIIDQHGQRAGVILTLSDYQALLKLLHQYADWEQLPAQLQDAIDNMLADEAEDEGGELMSLDAFLADAG